VPAAAVIPAPIAYIKVAAVKKLVVGFWGQGGRSAERFCTGRPTLPSVDYICSSLNGCQDADRLL
jgi:hypothetical protein